MTPTVSQRLCFNTITTEGCAVTDFLKSGVNLPEKHKTVVVEIVDGIDMEFASVTWARLG